jgi:hypothetical protein
MKRSSDGGAGARIARAVVAAAGVLVGFSCSVSSEPTGGETHFLTICHSDTCGPGLSCVCGVCTRPCAGADDCRDLPAAGCVSPLEGGSCSPSSAPASCDASCTSDADCGVLSPAHRCQGGRCRAGSSGAAGAGGSSASAGGVGGEAPGDPNACATGEVEANQVLLIGDRFFAMTHQITAYLEEAARAAGALSAGERYRDNSSPFQNTLSLGGNGIAGQYAAAAAEAAVKVVIMNGGGADAFLASCAVPGPDCTWARDASAAAEELFARMAADGVEHVVYAFYADPVDLELRARMDELRPLIQAVCGASPVPCHWVDLRATFAGRYDEYITADGMTPTAPGAQASAAAIWQTLEAACIAQ